MHNHLRIQPPSARGRHNNIAFFLHFIKKIFRLQERRELFLCSLLMLTALPLPAAFEEFYGGSSAAHCGAAVASTAGAESVWSNPAGIGLVNRAEASFAVGRPYGLTELSAGQVAVAFPLAGLHMAAAAGRFGNSLYTETQPTLAFGRAWAGIRAGIAFRWGQLAVKNYGHAAALMIDAGLQADWGRTLSWGMSLRNVNRAAIGRTREALPHTFSFGLVWRPQDNINLMAELNKDVRFPLDLRGGLAYRPLEAVTLRCGIGTEPQRFALGFSLQKLFCRFDYSYVHHFELGGTHWAGITLR